MDTPTLFCVVSTHLLNDNTEAELFTDLTREEALNCLAVNPQTNFSPIEQYLGAQLDQVAMHRWMSIDRRWQVDIHPVVKK